VIIANKHKIAYYSTIELMEEKSKDAYSNFELSAQKVAIEDNYHRVRNRRQKKARIQLTTSKIKSSIYSV